MFESIDLQVADEKESTEQLAAYTRIANCTRTGCYGTTCKWPC